MTRGRPRALSRVSAESMRPTPARLSSTITTSLEKASQGVWARWAGSSKVLRRLPLPVSAPFHSSLMKPAADALRARLADVAFAAPQIPVVNNIDVAVESDAARIKDALVRQAAGPVRWVETVQALQARGVAAVIECGPGKVLAGMAKRIAPDLTSGAIFDPASLAEAKQQLA